jgi:hypothetical protein
MGNDKKLFKWLALLILLPIALAIFGGDRYRYPCQDPKNWDKEICKLPTCDVTRTCPQHIFKGQRDPRLGPPDETINSPVAQTISNSKPTPAAGVNCVK